MFKTRLQELCHQKRWSAPSYSTTKDGLDHCPRFKASVLVNDVSFYSSDFCKSVKEAQNEAARVAYEHYASSTKSAVRVSPVSVTASSSYSPSPSLVVSSASNELNNKPGGTTLPAVNDDEEFGDVQHLCKNQLLHYTQKRAMKNPTYSCVHEGPPHAMLFKAFVTVDGQTFESPRFFHILREAEHAAAKVALSSLLKDGDREVNCSIYKNLLLDLIQKEGLSAPLYSTIKSGPPHAPIFVSTVEVKRVPYRGTEANTKRLAEMYAAKVAYSSLKQRGSRRTHALMSFSSRAPGTLGNATSSMVSSSISSITVDPQPILEPTANIIPAPIVGSQEIKNGQEAKSAEITNVANAFADVSINSLPKPRSTSTLKKMESSSSEIDPLTLTTSCPEHVPSPPNSQSLSLQTTSLSRDLPVPASSTFNNRIRVYPRKRNMTFPKDATVLPISNDKWVVVRLDFPKEQGN